MEGDVDVEPGQLSDGQDGGGRASQAGGEALDRVWGRGEERAAGLSVLHSPELVAGVRGEGDDSGLPGAAVDAGGVPVLPTDPLLHSEVSVSLQREGQHNRVCPHAACKGQMITLQLSSCNVMM